MVIRPSCSYPVSLIGETPASNCFLGSYFPHLTVTAAAPARTPAHSHSRSASLTACGILRLHCSFIMRVALGLMEGAGTLRGSVAGATAFMMSTIHLGHQTVLVHEPRCLKGCSHYWKNPRSLPTHSILSYLMCT